MTTLSTMLPIDLTRLPLSADGPVGAGQVAAALRSLLDVPVGNLALAGWLGIDEVRRARDRTRTSGSRETITLFEHKIASEQHPRLEVMLAGATRTLLTLDLNVEILIDGVELAIQGGEIVRSTPGQGRAAAELLAAGFVLARHELQPVTLETSFAAGGPTRP
jgi:hypothetical protein